MKNYITEFLKLNPAATAQWRAPHWKEAIMEEMPLIKEGIIIDVHGAKKRDIVIPEGCQLSINNFFAGVDGVFWNSDDKEAGCYIKGLDPECLVDCSTWHKKDKVFG